MIKVDLDIELGVGASATVVGRGPFFFGRTSGSAGLGLLIAGRGEDRDIVLAVAQALDSKVPTSGQDGHDVGRQGCEGLKWSGV